MSSAVDPQFMQALANLGKAGQEFFVGQQLQDINARAAEIRSAVMPDVERRRAMQELAQSATISAAGAGANSQQMAAIQNLIPPTPTSAMQAILAGQMNGDQLMVSVGQDILKQEEEREFRKMQRASDLEMQRIMASAATKEKQGKPAPPSALKSINSIQESKALLGQLKQLIASNPDAKSWIGPIDARIPGLLVSAEQKAFRAQIGQLIDAYRVAVTGAAASDAEIARLATRLPDDTATYEQFTSVLNRNLQLLSTRGAVAVDTMRRLRYDMSGFDDMVQGDPYAKPQAGGAGRAAPYLKKRN